MRELMGSSKYSRSHVSRRQLLQLGSLGWCGAGLPELFASDAIRDEHSGKPATFGKAKSCICLFLYGAWSQLDTLDMKPEAPMEYRGPFRPIKTTAPGVDICEHLPLTAKQGKHLAIVGLHHWPYLVALVLLIISCADCNRSGSNETGSVLGDEKTSKVFLTLDTGKEAAAKIEDERNRQTTSGLPIL